MSHTRESVIQEVKEFLTPEQIGQLYRQSFLNRIGCIPGTQEKYSEVVAAHLLENLSAFDAIKKISRESSYDSGHEPKEIDVSSPRVEEQAARSMMGKTYEYIGKIIDYQTPLKHAQSDDAGKIDLLSWNEEKGYAYIFEFKAPDSTEPLLRCLLELETYRRVVDGEKLLADFKLPVQTTLRKAVLVYQGSRPHTDFGDTNVKKLMKALQIDLFVLSHQIAQAHCFEELEG